MNLSSHLITHITFISPYAICLTEYRDIQRDTYDLVHFKYCQSTIGCSSGLGELIILKDSKTTK